MNDPWPKRLFRTLLYQTSRCLPSRYLFSIFQVPVVPLLWHVVGHSRIPHLRHLYGYPKPDEFAQDLDFLLGQFYPIGLHELDQAIDIAMAKKKPCVLLTFDDGLRQCKDTVAPILVEKGIPAVFFVNPSFVDNKDLMFRYKSSLILDKLPLEPQESRVKIASLLGCDPDIIEKKILEITYVDRPLLNAVAGHMQLDFSTYLANEKPYMTVADLKALANHGFDIGAHSLDHPLFAQLPLYEQHRQARESIQWVKSELPGQGHGFAFPFTDHGVTQETIEAIQGLCQWTFGCAGLAKESNPRHLQRLPLEVSAYRAREIVKGEMLYQASKWIIGRQKMNRA